MSTAMEAEIGVEELMQRIRRGFDGQNAGGAATVAHDDGNNGGDISLAKLASALDEISCDVHLPARLHLSLPVPTGKAAGNQPWTGEQDGCHVRDFYRYEGTELLNSIYRTLLRREVDDDGLACYLLMLRDGASKAEVIGRIAKSPEGKKHAVKVRGLGLAYFLDFVSRCAVIGRALGIARAIWNLPATERRIRQLSTELQYQSGEAEQRAAHSRHEIHDALRLLVRSQNELTDFARTVASDARIDPVRQVLRKVVSALHALELKSAKSVVQDALDLRISELRADIEAKAESQALATIQRELQAGLASKADRDDLEGSNAAVASLSTEARRLAEGLCRLEACKAECRTLENINHSLLRAIEMKADRHEMTGLANHVVTLLEQRATNDDLQHLSTTLEHTSVSMFASLRDKADARDVDTVRSECERKSRAGFDGINLALQGLAATKADRSSIATLRDEVTGALGAAVERAEQNSRVRTDELARNLEYLRERVSGHVGSETIKKEIGGELEKARTQLNAMIHKLADVKADRTLLEELRTELGERTAHCQKSASDTIERALGAVRWRAEDLRRQVIDQDRRLGLLLEEARKRFPKPIGSDQIKVMLSEDDHRLDAMYAQLEDQFRGTRAEIREKQAIYVPYIRSSKAGGLNTPVIDVGCGRGEWLELLRDEGIVAKGVDQNRIFLDGCRDLNLDVTEQDAITYLRDLKRNSVGAVTSFHLIEHLNHRTLVALIDEAFRVLRPGGVVIFETPNPRNLVVASCNFYLDPTHQRPLPPELSRYLLEARGFCRVEVKELHPHAPEQSVGEGAPGVRDALNRILHSAQDYAVMGWKA